MHNIKKYMYLDLKIPDSFLSETPMIGQIRDNHQP
jgi:hypothetical protein